MLAICILFVSLCVVGLKALEFRNKANSVLSNEKWEMFTKQVLKFKAPIVLFGDSQIAFWPVSICWGAQAVLNRGVAGEHSDAALHRFARDVINENAKTCIIEIGTNDIAHNGSPESIAAAIDSMISITQLAGVRPIICSILPTTIEMSKIRPKSKIIETNNLFRLVCIKRNVQYIDLNDILADNAGYLKDEYSKDGLHLSRKAYVRITYEIQKLI